ncbi:MAG TPA: protein-disulfide reductase DsbD [Gammaproteobacteria bacterium]|nr:protein-disulfide reductase DsbD [Gammaproteobacteria bacterium]
MHSSIMHSSFLRLIRLSGLLLLTLPGINNAQTAEPVTNTDAPILQNTISADQNKAANVISELQQLLGSSDDSNREFLDPNKAFVLQLTVADPSRLQAAFKVAKGYYLYQNKIKFTSDTPAVQFSGPQFPKADEKNDPYFGKMLVYHLPFTVQLPLRRASPDATQLVVQAEYQGCAEDGICYPPIKKQLTLDLPALLIAPAQAAGLTDTPNAATVTPGASKPAIGVAKADQNSIPISLWGYLLAAFGVGILLTFTPCVLPLIPILSSIIAGQGVVVTRLRGGMLALSYVLGTAVTYALVGAVAGATGEQLQAYMQNIWVLGTIAILFVVMALSMFGLYTIQLPGWMQSRLVVTTSKIPGGTYGMVFVLGLLSALIVGACVSPALISLLSVAIVRGDPWFGAELMFVMALGMGVFLVILGLGAGTLLPKVGAWMDQIKYVFGVMMLAVAIYLLRVIPEVPVMLLWAALFIVVGVYLGATQALPDGVSGWRRLWKGLGTILLLWGALALVGQFTGSRDIMAPLPALSPSLSAGTPSVGPVNGAREVSLFHRVANVAELDRLITSAGQSGKYVFLDFYADWCTDCLRMDKNTFREARVKALMKKYFVMLQVDVTDPYSVDGRELKRRYGVFGPPAMLFFNPRGKEMRGQRLYGYRDADEFLTILNKVVNNGSLLQNS